MAPRSGSDAPRALPPPPPSGTYEPNNPMPHIIAGGYENVAPLDTDGGTFRSSDKLVLVMVGLPATGKTHISRRVCRYFNFFHDIPTQIFNVGDYRRRMCGSRLPASFYDHSDPEALRQRTAACRAALDDLVDYLREDGARIAVYDATNTTRERRGFLVDQLERSSVRAKVIFVESICEDEKLVEENIRSVKVSTPDYQGMDPEEAVRDFNMRRDRYIEVYETLGETEAKLAYLKVIDCRQFIVNNIRGYLPLKVIHFIMNLHTSPRTFYLTRHGQSEYNTLGKIGGDSGLSKAGLEYARRLARYADGVIGSEEEEERDGDWEGEKTTHGGGGEAPSSGRRRRPARLWTSTLRRTKETAQFIEHHEFEHEWDNGDTVKWVQFRPQVRRNLDELYAGTCDGMTYTEIEKEYSEEFERRQKDKLRYRYQRGESYMDVTLRLEPLAHEMERTREPILIVGHQGILRILYAYFMGLSREEAPYISIPLNHVIKLTPHAYGCQEERVCLMDKEEMLNDGQDEPITSMPLKKANAVDQKAYADDDPIMNAPSN